MVDRTRRRGGLLTERDAPAATTPRDERPEQSPWLPDVVEPAGSSLSETKFAALDPKRLERAVSAYCNELLDSRPTAEATETILSRFNAVADGSRATADELLRLTRKTATDYARAPDAWRGLTSAVRREECRATPARIAARDGNTLAAAARAELDAHLDRCLSCQAIDLRLQCAGRAFATTLEATTEDDPHAAAAEQASASGAAAVAGRTRRRRLRGIPAWQRLASRRSRHARSASRAHGPARHRRPEQARDNGGPGEREHRAGSGNVDNRSSPGQGGQAPPGPESRPDPPAGEASEASVRGQWRIDSSGVNVCRIVRGSNRARLDCGAGSGCAHAGPCRQLRLHRRGRLAWWRRRLELELRVRFSDAAGEWPAGAKCADAGNRLRRVFGVTALVQPNKQALGRDVYV